MEIYYIDYYRRNMYKGKQKAQDVGFSRSILNSTILSETTNQTMEKQIDNYTRLLQQDKRKFFRLQGNKEDIMKDFVKKTKELQNLKSPQSITENSKKKSELKLLQQELEQSINSYNQVVSNNKSLRHEIDQLRKAKINQKTTSLNLINKIEEFRAIINGKEKEIIDKNEHIEISKQQIIKIRGVNQAQAKKYGNQVQLARTSLFDTKAGSFLTKKKGESDQKNQTTDTQPLVKYRLRQLIHSNKQRVRIIESYQKNMNAIFKSFADIKQESGIEDIEEITNIFLKHEEQNHFIYEYINKLNKELQEIGEYKEELKNKIQSQQQLNKMYLSQAGTTPEKQELIRKDRQFIETNKKKIDDFHQFMSQGQSVIDQIKQSFGLQAGAELTQFNLQDELSVIQNLLIEHVQKQDKFSCIKDDVTRYSRSPPGCLDDIKDKQQRLIDAQRMRQYASDYWEKRRNK